MFALTLMVISCVLLCAPAAKAEGPEAAAYTNKALPQEFLLQPQKEKARSSFLEFINAKAYAAPVNEDQEDERIRQEWKKVLQVDVFYPYYKAKEVEDWVSEKAKIDIFSIRGKPKFRRNHAEYIFKMNF